MKRIDTPTAVADKHGAGKAGFADADLPLVPATQLDASWFDAVQEELANAVEGSGRALDSGDNTQLLQATRDIRQISGRAASRYSVDRGALPVASLEGIIWASDRYLVLAFSGIIYRSLTGASWSASNALADFGGSPGLAIAYSPALARTVAVCSNKTTKAAYSSDGGETLTAATGLEAAWWLGVCWSPELARFCAVGTTSGTSADGITWTEGNLSMYRAWSVAWSPTLGLFCAVGGTVAGAGGYTCAVSSDGVDWTYGGYVDPSVAGYNTYRGVVWSERAGRFFSVRAAEGGQATALTSVDGLTWSIDDAPIATTETLRYPIWIDEWHCWCCGTESGLMFFAPDLSWRYRRDGFGAIGGSGAQRLPCWSEPLKQMCVVTYSEANSVFTV
jgi:hypothetical protein